MSIIERGDFENKMECIFRAGNAVGCQIYIRSAGTGHPYKASYRTSLFIRDSKPYLSGPTLCFLVSDLFLIQRGNKVGENSVVHAKARVWIKNRISIYVGK